MRKQLVWTLFRNDPRSVRTSGGSITYEVESSNSMVLAVVSSSTTAAAAGKRRSKNVTVVVFVVWMVVACCASSLPIASSALLRGGGGSPRTTNRRRTTTDYDHETNLPRAEDEDQHDHIRRQLKKGKGREWCMVCCVVVNGYRTSTLFNPHYDRCVVFSVWLFLAVVVGALLCIRG